MAKQTSIFAPTGINNAAVTFVAADTTTIKDIVSADADDSVVRSVLITSDDTSAHSITFYLHDGSTNFLLETVSVPALSGTTTSAPSIEALDSTLFPRNLPIKGGWKLRAKMNATVTAAKTVTVISIAEDF